MGRLKKEELCTPTLNIPSSRITFIHNTILNMYAKCGALDDARKLSNKMPSKDMVTWTALISGYSQNDRAEDALVLFPQMLHFGLQPN